LELWAFRVFARKLGVLIKRSIEEVGDGISKSFDN
jgi:hypothetical protein